MKLIHTADLHFGRKKHSILDVNTGLPTSLLNDMQVMDEVLLLAEQEGVDVFMIAGDFFDTVSVSNPIRKEVANKIAKILAKMHLVVVVGTHDRTHDACAAHTLSDLQALAEGLGDGALGRLHIFDQPVVSSIKIGKEAIQFIALPEPTRADLQGKTYSEYFEEHLERMSSEIDPKVPCVAMGHFHVDGASVGDEVIDRQMNIHGSAQIVPPSVLERYEFIDYVAMGHIHKCQVLGDRKIIHYPGSLNYCTFTEKKEEKGVWLLDLSSKKKLKTKFVKVDKANPLLEIQIDARNQENVAQYVEEQLSLYSSISGSITKVVVHVSPGQKSSIEKPIVLGRLSVAGAVHGACSIIEESVSSVRTPELKDSMPLKQALEIVVGNRAYDASFGQDLLKAGHDVIDYVNRENVLKGNLS